ncbi:hypothetical protein [Lentzea aerocolonigenes]|nr:hypothetical protein [Lentzea aerocolonigenes]MCP2243930.1 hypothetical protein [Lentzea aerocolonigenes]
MPVTEQVRTAMRDIRFHDTAGTRTAARGGLVVIDGSTLANR